jgi:hypothetical protein
VICMGYCIVLSKFVEHHVYGDMWGRTLVLVLFCTN